MTVGQTDAADRGPYLLCFDDSDCAGDAIRRAGSITEGGPALVVHAWLPPSALLLQGRGAASAPGLTPAIEEFDAAAREGAEGIAARGAEIAAGAGFEAEPLAIEAPHGIWRPIVALAQERDARAVVVGSHGLSPAKSVLLGSVSRGVVNHCGRPVLVVPPDRP